MPLDGTSSARQYLEMLRSLGPVAAYDYLASLVSTPEPTFEQEWLDFKGSPLDVDVGKIWSKILSAFANTTDGLLIWGIDAREDRATKIDKAGNLNLIRDPPAFRTRLDKLLSHATDPPVMGIEMEIYRNSSGSGFVVCFIPESKHKPHCAEGAGGRYYCRAGTSSNAVGSGLLRTLFYPHRNSQFDIEMIASCVFHPNPGNDMAMFAVPTYSAKLLVSGNASVRDVFLTINHAIRSVSFKRMYTETYWDFLGSTRIGEGFVARRTFHPGEECPIFSVQLDRENSPELTREGDVYSIDLSQEPMHFAVHASDQERQTFEVDLSELHFSYDGTGDRAPKHHRVGKRVSLI